MYVPLPRSTSIAIGLSIHGKVADELQVDTLLTGNYIEEGDQLRISTQLIDIKANKIIWRDTVDLTFDKLLTVQDRVSQEIVNGLELKLSPAEADHLKPEPRLMPAPTSIICAVLTSIR